jgi:peptide/nickel transport system substrate-binding protein
MNERHAQPSERRLAPLIGALGGLVMLISTARCGGASGPSVSISSAAIRIGVGGVPQLTAQAGLQQVISSLSFEGLVRFHDDGRPSPWLAENWTTAEDNLSVTLQLRKQATFHDGTPLTAAGVVDVLRRSLPIAMGPAFADVVSILPLDGNRVQVRLREPSRLLIEALETTIRKPEKLEVGTGPYVATTASGPATLQANSGYYLGRPTIERVTLVPYPSVRTAWAELLRNNLDMLYEVNMDALDSLKASSSVSVFSYLRHYQYVIMFGNRATSFRSAAIRRALNAAVDREALVREVLNGHGVPSTGPVPPTHWALDKAAPKLMFDPRQARELAQRHLKFTCLVASDSVYGRMALAIKQQLATASVDMQVQEVTQDQIIQAGRTGDFEALLIDVVSGPSIFRLFRQFYSKVPFELKPAGNHSIDAALDRIRHAPSDDEYRNGVTDFQRAVVEDPPEIFLVWGERARAVSRRFEVPSTESGSDITSLRLWRPTTVQQQASRN